MTQNKVLVFDEKDDYIEVKEPFKNNKEFTISLWLKPILFKNWISVLGKQEDLYRKPSLWVCANNGLHYDSFSSTGARFYDILQGFFIAPNQWIHIAWVKQGKEYKFYRNGELFATRPGPEIFYTTDSSYFIGRVSNFFVGELTDVQIWSCARTQAEIQQDMPRRLRGNEPGLVSYWPLNEGEGTIAHDKTITANHGTIQGNATWVESDIPLSAEVQPKPIPKDTTATKSEESLQTVLAFNGQDNAINLGKKPQFKIEKSITLEAWICVTSQKAYAGIISNIYDTGSTESGYGLLLDGKSGIYFGLKVASVGMQYLSSGANTIILNQWHHIAGTYDGQEMKLYIDGIEKAKQAWPGNNINYNPENNLLFGMYKDDDEVYAFPGKIAEIRLWKITRTPQEIQNNLYRSLAGNESGLVGYWPLNEGSNNVVNDRTSNTNHGVINGAKWERSQVPFTMPISPEESSLPKTPNAESGELSKPVTTPPHVTPPTPAPQSLTPPPPHVTPPTPAPQSLTPPHVTPPTPAPQSLTPPPPHVTPPTPAPQSLTPPHVTPPTPAPQSLTPPHVTPSPSPTPNEPLITSEESGKLSEPEPNFPPTETKPDNTKITSWIELEPVRRQVAIYGQISDAETGLTIHNALVEITQMPETFKQWLILRSQKYGSQWDTVENRPDRKRTAIDGYFHFLDLPDGEYTLTASLPSAGTCYGTVEVKAIANRDSQGNYVKTVANMMLPPTAIKGKITDSNGTPIALAKIQIARTTDYIFSDSKGNYLFSNLKTSKASLKHTVNIHVSARGFQPASQSAELSQGAVQNVNFVLKNS